MGSQRVGHDWETECVFTCISVSRLCLCLSLLCLWLCLCRYVRLCPCVWLCVSMHVCMSVTMSMWVYMYMSMCMSGLPWWVSDEEPACQCNTGLIPGSGRCPWEGNGNPLQYSCWEDSMVRGTWRAIVHGVTKSWSRLSNWTITSVYVYDYVYMYYIYSIAMSMSTWVTVSMSMTTSTSISMSVTVSRSTCMICNVSIL